MKRVAILQSNYIPWKGYFDLIGAVDEFVFYDDVQYTTRDWRNRNRIKTPHGVQWLSIPVGASTSRSIREVEIRDADCGKAHWKRLVANYARAPHFDAVAEWLEPLYCDAPWKMLAATNRSLIEATCRFLGIVTTFGDSSSHAAVGGRNERLIGICRGAGADAYVSGPAARDYLDVAAFRRAGLDVHWFDYSEYPEYPQLWGAFVHEVSIVDLLFQCGASAPAFMKLGVTAHR